MIRTFTGRHMLMLTMSFFGVIIAVNMVMATFAVRTFGGTIVDNSYVASQQYNHWLDEAHAQQALGWRLTAEREGDHAVVRLPSVPDVRIDATAIHPLGRLPDMNLHFRPVAPGRFRSIEALPAGRWRLELRVRQGDREGHFIDEVPA